MEFVRTLIFLLSCTILIKSAHCERECIRIGDTGGYYIEGLNICRCTHDKDYDELMGRVVIKLPKRMHKAKTIQNEIPTWGPWNQNEN